MNQSNVESRIKEEVFYSSALRGEKKYCVVLPRNYHVDALESEFAPSLLLLHGRGRNARSLVDDEIAGNELLKADFAIILPNGDDGWYVNSPVDENDKYEDYLTEVVGDAAAKYKISPDRKERGVAGWSMGGYGAAMFAERHNDQFAALATIIGLLDFPREGLPEGQNYQVPVERFGADHSVWSEYNPINNARRLSDTSILLVVADDAFDKTMNLNFSQELDKIGIKHELRRLQGGHSFDVVRTALPLVLDFFKTRFGIQEEI